MKEQYAASGQFGTEIHLQPAAGALCRAAFFLAVGLLHRNDTLNSGDNDFVNERMLGPLFGKRLGGSVIFPRGDNQTDSGVIH